MKTILKYTEYLSLNESLNTVYDTLENEYKILEKVTLDDIDKVKAKNVGGGVLMTGLRILFWLSPLFPLMILRELVKIVRKSIRIKLILKDETDPVKKAQLKVELKELKERELKFLKRLDNARTKAEKKAEQDYKKGEAKKLKDSQKLEAKKKAEEYKKLKDELKKAREEEKNIK